MLAIVNFRSVILFRESNPEAQLGLIRLQPCNNILGTSGPCAKP